MNIFSAGIAATALAASLLASAPATAATTYVTTLYSTDYGAKAVVYWHWEGAYRRTSGFQLYDRACDGKAARLTFYRGAYTTVRSWGGCGTSHWFSEQINFNYMQLCNGVGTNCGPKI
ncbi:MAG TPA: hypothetical protein VF800_02140 [Telluria sp.]